MSERTGISWAHHTFNGAWGCTEVSPGCDHCYARDFVARLGYVGGPGDDKPTLWGPAASRRTFGDGHWNDPLRWDRAAAAAGERRRVFAYSMADWCDAHPSVVALLPRLWQLVRDTPNLDWLLCTKRHGRLKRSLPPDWGAGYPNVWLGVTAENAYWAQRRIPRLLDLPAAVRWVSAEPLIGSMTTAVRDFTALGVDWWVFGGESGAQRRELSPAWLAGAVAAAAGSAVFVKQDSDRRPGQRGRIPDELWRHEFPT